MYCSCFQCSRNSFARRDQWKGLYSSKRKGLYSSKHKHGIVVNGSCGRRLIVQLRKTVYSVVGWIIQALMIFMTILLLSIDRYCLGTIELSLAEFCQLNYDRLGFLLMLCASLQRILRYCDGRQLFRSQSKWNVIGVIQFFSAQIHYFYRFVNGILVKKYCHSLAFQEEECLYLCLQTITGFLSQVVRRNILS